METNLLPIDLKDKILMVRGQYVMLDADVAEIYGVQTKEINQAVKNNPQKFPNGYIITPSNEDLMDLRSKILTANDNIEINNSNLISPKSRYTPKLFTERGLYMLATILKGERATRATLSIIETYAQVRELRRDLIEMHVEKDKDKQKSLMERFSEALTEIVMPDMQIAEAEASLELNFVIGKLKHTVRRRRTPEQDVVEHE